MKYLLVLIFSFNIFAQSKKQTPQEKKVIYKYKKFEKFDFDEMSIAGDTSNPGDLSINPRFKKEFKNYLPAKPNFNREMRKSILSLK